jgi:uncharacterized protein with FMN-binding domain
MRRIAIAIATTVSALVLLFSYDTSTNRGPVTSASVPVGSAVPSPSSATGTTPSTAQPAPTSTGVSGMFNGGAVDTRYGPVQVQITLSAGKITAAQTLQVPQESDRDVRINTEAVPILVQETLQAQSAQIDTVSGATYTSDGYTRSLQSAIDAAHG